MAEEGPWKNLYSDIFIVLGKYLDGKDASNCAATCKSWNNIIKKNNRLSLFRKLHYIYAKNAKEIEKALLIEKNMKLEISKKHSQLFKQILWFRNKINIWMYNNYNDKFYESYDRERKYDIENIHNIIKHAGYKEEDEDFMSDSNGNVCIVNNYYSSSEIEKEKISSFTMKMVTNLEKLEAFFEGTFSWKIIKFPERMSYEKFDVNGKEFHRGECLQCFFRSNGLGNEIFPIEKELKKWKIPLETVTMGTGKNKREVTFQHPQIKEVDLSNLIRSFYQ